MLRENGPVWTACGVLLAIMTVTVLVVLFVGMALVGVPYW